VRRTAREAAARAGGLVAAVVSALGAALGPALVAALGLGACSSNHATASHDMGNTEVFGNPGHCNGSIPSSAPMGPAPTTPNGLVLPTGFTIETIAHVGGARELVALPNGDLLVATSSDSVYIVPNVEAAGAAGAPSMFATFGTAPSSGLTFDPSSCTVYAGANDGVYAMPYSDGALTAPSVHKIASVRTGQISPGTDGDVHVSTSVAVAGGKLYASVGSSCNACVEVDPTRASIQVMNLDGSAMTTRATRIRNAVALAENPATGTLWGGGAGQDNLPFGHPFEFFDAVSLHAGVADYGWPACEENQNNYGSGANCSSTVTPLVELPAYQTLIGAVFYPAGQTGTYAFPPAWRGLFLAGHGSWHRMTNNSFQTPPRVAFVSMSGDIPATAMNWSNPDPTSQWTEMVGGFQLSDGVTRIGRPTGLAVGSQGSLFVGDDQSGVVYRIRPQ
jgi:glucose/arabinose dehydrogenase